MEILSGGSNTPILIQKTNDITYVIKQYGFENITNNLVPHLTIRQFQSLLNDYLNVRKKVNEAGILVPKLYDIFYTNDNKNYTEFKKVSNEFRGYVRLIIKESYCGISLKNIIENQENYVKYLNMAYSEIYKMPKNIELDTNPANFTYLDNKLYFVDFMPPKIEKYQKVRKWLKLFPQLEKREEGREYRRNRRYRTYYGRIERFTIYSNNLISKKKKLLPPHPQPQIAQQSNP